MVARCRPRSRGFHDTVPLLSHWARVEGDGDVFLRTFGTTSKPSITSESPTHAEFYVRRPNRLDAAESERQINATRTGTLPVRLYDFAPHYLSAITIGLASYLVVLESLWLWRGNHVYRQLHHYRSTIFGVNPAMRGVSGLAGAYQFGTNWSYLSGFAGRVLRSNQQVFTDA
jgi:hypothetical protein